MEESPLSDERPPRPPDPKASAASSPAAPTASAALTRAEELSQVVLRRDPGAGPGLRALRPLAFAALFLSLAEILLRLTLPPDPRMLRDPLHPYGCYQDDALAALLDDPRKDGLDVVLLGDSVLSSVNNRPGERIQDYLEPALRRRLQERGVPADTAAQVRVWSLGEGGSHAADLYAAFRRLMRQAPPRPLLVVLNSNIIFFSRRHANPPMLYPCLADTLGPEDDDLRAALRLPPPADPVEAALTRAVTRHVYLFQQRRRLGEALFGGPPRDRLRDGLLGALNRLRQPRGVTSDDPNLPWSARGLTAAQYAPNYDLIPFDSPEARNLALTRRLAGLLAAPRRAGRAADPGVSVFVFLTPHNHGLLGALADNPGYHAASAAIGAIFRERGVPFRSYDGDALVADRYFMDLDHLTADGNRRLAGLLLEDLAAPALDLLRTGRPGGP